ncbi:MAG: Na+/H+ antiporter NhaC family protein [Clostridia bacterium]|nr:Na+/H+ antiporter NhaC family protein [Clostridia bacterium]
MSKVQKIVLCVAALVIVALLIVCGVTDGAKKTVNCPDCKKVGHFDCTECVNEETGAAIGWVACESCTEAAAIDPTCVYCRGTGLVLCEACEGSLVTDCETCSAEGSVVGSLWALLPPVIAIGLALITKEVYSSLFIGILAGAMLYADFAFNGTVDALINDGLISAVSGTAGIFIFLVELGIIVALINKTGGSAAFGRWAKTHIKTRAGAMIATFFFGVLIFIDDYFNCLTVGSVMQPITDKHKISRAKLAYLIDATAAPICMIAPISSWAAAVSQYAEDGQGLNLFISAIPFNFYSLLTFVFIITMAVIGYDYGSMRIHEVNAMEKDDLFTSGDRVSAIEAEEGSSKGRVIDLILPIIVLLAVSVYALVYVGGIFDGSDFITAFGDTDATVALPWAGLISLIVTVIYYILRGTISFKDSMGCIPKGFIAMVPAILILTFATALKNMTSALGAKYYVADLMNSAAAELSYFLPAIIFLVACVLAFSTGTSWGTFGILIPIVDAMFTSPEDATIRVICISACLAGAVCGDHCSPISDTTIMSSAGAGCDHLNHVSTQIPYAITVAAISFVMFILAGFIQNAWICLPIGIALTVATVLVMKMISSRRQKAKDAK